MTMDPIKKHKKVKCKKLKVKKSAVLSILVVLQSACQFLGDQSAFCEMQPFMQRNAEADICQGGIVQITCII